MLRDMFEDMPIITTFLVLIILGIAFVLTDSIASKPEPFCGIVIDKQYEAERNSIGTGYGITSGGKGGVIITSEHEDEQFLLIVKKNNGNIVTVPCSPELYYEKKMGQRIFCNAYKGVFTGYIWDIKGVN